MSRLKSEAGMTASSVPQSFVRVMLTAFIALVIFGLPRASEMLLELEKQRSRVAP